MTRKAGLLPVVLFIYLFLAEHKRLNTHLKLFYNCVNLIFIIKQQIIHI